ncbi:uncharacterized protein LOC131623842 [Vicia villosa]|uniref:uncharacterized protein LOC131623842 n=1 Tax=Vicia villosa TaxID=3911 RepID=UPI00273B4DD2|nr:uncharacterized protein LOC131623842 [Vicia villosa]
MANLFILLSFLLASIFKSNNAFPDSSNISHENSTFPSHPYYYFHLCGEPLSYMAVQCLNYFKDNNSYQDGCCSAIEFIILESTLKFCMCGAREEGNASMTGAMATKLPPICGISLNCDSKSNDAPKPYPSVDVFWMLVACWVVLSTSLFE